MLHKEKHDSEAYLLLLGRKKNFDKLIKPVHKKKLQGGHLGKLVLWESGKTSYAAQWVSFK